MRVIDSDHYSASGIETFFFPGGEPHARIPKDFGDALLFLKARTWNDFGLALVVMDALQQQACEHPTCENSDGKIKVWCFAAYLPGARQDRSDGQTPITRNIYIDTIRDMADKLFTFDVHSKADLTYAYTNYMPSDLLSWVTEPGNLAIIAPDHGAVDRANNFAGMLRGYDGLPTNTPVVVCEKTRDFATGNFTGFVLPPLPPAEGYLIVDDICDGGGTFNLLAAEFDKVAPKDAKLGLWVSHGIFSKGVRAINPRIDHIYTTDSWCKSERWGLDVVPLQRIIDLILEDADV